MSIFLSNVEISTRCETQPNAMFAQIDNLADSLNYAKIDKKTSRELSEIMRDINIWRNYFRKLTEHFTLFTHLLGNEEEIGKWLDEKPHLLWLNDRLDEMIKILEVQAKERKIRTIIGLKQPGLPCDVPLRITELQAIALDVILFNLLTNAYRYADYNSLCHINLDLLMSEELREFRPELAKSILILIENKGIGVPEYEKDTIFKKGFRGSNAFSTGTGYGLWIAYKAAELILRGNLSLESWKKEKTIFCLELPARFVSWREQRKNR